MNPTPNQSSKGMKMLAIIILFVILIALSYVLANNYHVLDESTVPVVETPATTSESVATTTPTTTDEMTHGNGTINFSVPKDFGLAVTADQVLVKAYIPPCEQNFDYCIYYNGTEFKGTNFESAGIRIKQRADLKNPAQCQSAQPLGNQGMKSTVVASTSEYVLSVFSPIGDAGAGHYASGELYRLATNGTCQEFETRIGASQFANYPAGSIKEFGAAGDMKVNAMLNDILNGVTLQSGQKIQFVK